MKKTFTFVIQAVVALLLSINNTQGQSPVPKVEDPVYFDVSPPLRDMIPTDTPSRIKSLNKDAEKREYPFYQYEGPDPVWQKQMGTMDVSDGITHNFAGTNCLSGLSPSDDNGDIGPNHYVQTVNSKLQIFNRTGTSLYGPVNINTLFSGIPGGTYNDGDPIVLYDQVADRWLISEFSISGTTEYMLIAVSTSADPTGSYYRWSYSWGTSVPDYPKFGVWRDSYLLGLNCGTDDVAAFNRTQMIAGNASPQVVKFDNPWRPNSGLHCIQPCDNDGTFAPAGSPGLFVTINDNAWGGSDQLWVYALTVDWASPGSATFNRIHTLGVSAFDSNFGGTWDNIPQPGTTQKICVLPQILMYRAQYRNFGTHQSIVCCHDVDVNGSDHAGIRWYELRKTGASWTVYQQSSYAPDAHHRWMGSISQNASGEIALGFSIASSTIYPSIRYTGRVSADALGTMTFAENTIYNGTQSQTNGNRWGDYTSMSVDPNDDKTFWYTAQYAGGSAWNWYTRIASFKFDLYCTASGGCSEYISRVQLGTIDNVSTCDGYRDYSDISTDLPLNAAKTLTVTNGSPYSLDQCGVWIDWNRDNDFSDANETITVTGNPGYGPYTALIDPPASATIGAVRMRIRITYTGSVAACGATSYGEVEDYTINLTSNATTNTWLGITSTDWNTGSNWSLGTVPSEITDVSIPSGTIYQPTIGVGLSAYAKNVTILSGAVLTQAGSTGNWFYVYGDFNSDAGQFTMSGTSYLYFDGANNNSWDDDNENDTYTYVRVEKTSGTAQTTMWQNMTCTGNLEVREGVFAIDGTWTLTVTGTGSTAFEVEDGGKLVLTDETIDVAGSITFFDGSQAAVSGGTIKCGGNLNVNTNTSYNIVFTGGTLIMDGSSTQYINDLDGGNLDLDNLTIAKSGGVCYIQSANLDINDGLIISGGALSCDNGPTPTATYNIYVAGYWTNSVGPGGFIESTGRVIFDGGNYHQYCSNETFNILEVNKPSGGAFRVDAGNVICAQFDWTAGAVDVNTGAFTANDLADNGLFGAYYVNPGGTINLTNSGSGTYVDLRGELHIFGGTINVSGSISEWPYLGNAVLEMSGGILDFKTCGIVVSNNAYTLTDDITGGIIRTAYGFSGNRADFTPVAGIFEFYGSGDSYISQSNGCTLYNVNINKSSKDGSLNKPEVAESGERIDMTWIEGGKANSILLGSNFTITNNLTISAGSFVLNGYQGTVANLVDVYGSLVMNNALDILYAGTGSYDNLTFYNGSNSSLTAGSIYPASWVWSQSGATISGTSGNTIYFAGSNTSGIEVDGPGSVFGNVDINKSGGAMLLFCFASPAELAGYFNVHAGNVIQMQGSSMIVHGVVTDNSTSTIHLDTSDKGDDPQVVSASNESTPAINGAKGGSLIIDTDLTINGLWNVLSGSVLLHGGLTIANTGILNITSGSFICDKPAVVSDAWQYINGTLNLTSGLFEITNNSPYFGTTASTNISGGIIRAGVGFNSSLTAGVFDPTGGVVEISGVIPDGNIFCYPGNWFYDLRINSTGGNASHFFSDTKVINDVIIDGGSLACGYSGSFSLYIGSDFNNNVGNTGYSPGTGTVYFDGTGALNHQFINGTTIFYNLENAKSGGGYLRIVGDIDVNNNFLANGTNIVDGPTLDINNLLLSTGEMGLTTGAPNVTVSNFTMGGVLSVTNGSFMCTDVTNNGIYGTINLTNGSITLFQDAAQYPDLNANVTINGGYMAVNNGNGGSLWGYGAPCSITMTNGTLDFNNNGIYMNNVYSVTESITGGSIKTNMAIVCENTNFNPAGGTIELYGGTDAYIATLNNSSFFNLLINKSGGDKGLLQVNEINTSESAENKLGLQSMNELQSSKNNDRPKMLNGNSKANTINTSGALRVNGTTTVEEGTLQVDNYLTTCMNNIIVNSGGKLAIGDYGTLAIETGKSLTVNNGGFLDVTGSAGGVATITHNTGYYGLNVESGGTIGVVYGTFEYMNTSGVNVKTGALVDNLKPFNYCTFRNGQTGGTLLTVNNSQTFYVENAVFPTNTWSGASNVTKTVNSGMVYFITATGGFAGESFDNDTYSRIMWTNRSLSLKAFLEGPFNGTTMNTTLNTILPLSHPFNPALPYFGNPSPDWRYTGAGSVAVIPNVNIVDWVLVDLRDAVSAAAATPATSIAKFPAFILNNGNIVGLNGSSNLEFTGVIANSLFVVIYQRNHQSIMSASPVSYTAGAYTYDYTTGAAQVYGGATGHKQLATGKWGMRSGDGNGDCDILLNDKTQVWGIPTQLGKTGYLPSDYNFDRQTNNKDQNDKWVPNINTYSQVPN